MKKIPHPWWHWFFTKLLEERYSGSTPWKRWYTMYCSKCHKIYELEGELNDIQVISSD